MPGRIDTICKKYNVTVEELKIIYKHETGIIKSQLANQFPSFYARYNRKISFSEYEKLIFPTIEEVIGIDILCLHKLEDGSDIAAFFKENDILERIKFAYNIDDEAMTPKFNALPAKAKEAINLLFRSTSENVTIEDILEILNVDYDGLNRIVRSNLRSLYLDFIKKSQQEKVKKKSFVLPKYFYGYFEKDGYTHDDIRTIVERYNASIRNTLQKIYGVDYGESKNIRANLTAEDIKNLKIVFIDPETCLTHIIDKNINLANIPNYSSFGNKFNLKNYYISLGYSKETVEKNLIKLCSAKKRILNLYFQLDYSLKPDKILNFYQMFKSGNSSKAYNLIFNPNDGIQQILKNIDNEPEICRTSFCNENGMIIDIYHFYEKLGYKKETIDRAQKQVSVEVMKLIHESYNSNLILTEEFPSSKEQLKSITSVLISPDTGLGKIILDDKHMPNPDSSVTEKVYSNYYVHLGIRGIPANYVKKAISLLDSHEKSILNKYYTSKACIRKNIVIDEEELDALFAKIIYLAVNYDKLIEKKKQEEYKSVKELLTSLGYSDKLIIKTLDTLNETDIEKIISTKNFSENLNESLIATLIQIIIKCEYFTKINNLKEFILSLGFTDVEFIEFLGIINKYRKDFDLTSYFDIETFELKHEYLLNPEKLEELRHHLDYFLTLYIHYKTSNSNIIYADNIYYSTLDNINTGIKKSIEDNDIKKAGIDKKFSHRDKDYYIMLTGLTPNYSFDGITEILLYKSLFDSVFGIMVKDKLKKKKLSKNN